MKIIFTLISITAILSITVVSYAAFSGKSIREMFFLVKNSDQLPSPNSKQEQGRSSALKVPQLTPTNFPTLTPIPSPTLAPSPVIKKSSIPEGLVLISGEYFTDEYCRLSDVDKIRADDQRRGEIFTKTQDCRMKTSIGVNETKSPCYTDEENNFLISMKLYFQNNCVSKVAYELFGSSVWSKIGF